MLHNLCLLLGPFIKNPLQHMRSHQDCPIPFPCAFSFLILQYALRFPGGSAKKNGAASNQSHQFYFFGRPPPLWETLCGTCPRRWRHCDVYAMSATVMWRVM